MRERAPMGRRGGFMGKKLGALILALLSGGVAVGSVPKLTAQAGTQNYYGGSAVSGAIPFENSAVKLEQEELTVHVGTLPAVGGTGVYDAYCDHSYTFYNPTEEAATVRALLPCVAVPQYAADYAAEETVLQLDGNDIRPSVRYSYAGYYNRTMDVDDSLAQLTEEPMDDFYCREGLSVTEYRFKLELSKEALEGVDRKYLAFVLMFECNPLETRVMSCNRMSAEIVNGRMQASFDVEEGQNLICLTVVGEDVTGLTHGVYIDRYREQEIEIGTFFYSETRMPFADFAMRGYPKDSEISREDWYRGFVHMLAKGTGRSVLVSAIPELIREEMFMRWYDYDLTVPPKTSVVHTVREPIYPTVDDARYDYSVLLSPQQRWKPWEVKITIDTPYYLAYSSLEFDKTEEGYCFARKAMPLGELSFTLTESDRVGITLPIQQYVGGSPSLRLAYILLGVLGGTLIIAGGVIFVVYRVRKKRK